MPTQALFLSDAFYAREFGHGRYMGPYAVASQLRNAGFSALVIDYFQSKPDFLDYFENFLSPETLIVGLSSTFLNPRKKKQDFENLYASMDDYFEGELHVEDGQHLSLWLNDLKSRILKRAPRAKLVLGGTKAIRAFQSSKFYKDFDYICLGAGDHSIVQLMKKLVAGELPESKVYEGYSGLNVLADMQLKTDVAQCPDACFGIQDGIQRYESLPIEISRGCTFNCKFCHYEKKTSLRKPVDVLRNELIRNFERFGTTIYHFTDDCFNDHPAKVESICNLLLNLPFKIEWVSYARTDVAIKFPHTIELMVESGARALFWGIESLDDVTARKAGKGTPTEAVKKFLLDFVQRYGDRCLTAASFIIGLPGESKESIQRTLDFICNNNAMDLLTVSPLGLAAYHESLDMKVIDYSDYSRNPGKYGFSKISFRPEYWEHAQMNSIEAKQLSKQFLFQWRAAHNYFGLSSIWYYTHLRTLGYSHDEVASLFRTARLPSDFDQSSGARFEKFLRNYFDSLVIENKATKANPQAV
jgi:radical SAM superfamily enzyme YgiQ (UPF0313 family)